jgi:hypothetical protein
VSKAKPQKIIGTLEKDATWSYRRVAGNGRKVDTGEGFDSLEDAQMAAAREAGPDVELAFEVDS